MLTELALIKKVKRTGTVVVYLQQQIEFVPKYNLYTMNINCGRNCRTRKKKKNLIIIINL